MHFFWDIDDDDDDDDRRKKRNLNSYPYTFSDPILVGKGSVMGVYLRSPYWIWSPDPLPVIGECNSELPDKGVCKTSQNSFATNIDCPNGSNEENYLLHVEAEIGKFECYIKSIRMQFFL